MGGIFAGKRPFQSERWQVPMLTANCLAAGGPKEYACKKDRLASHPMQQQIFTKPMGRKAPFSHYPWLFSHDLHLPKKALTKMPILKMMNEKKGWYAAKRDGRGEHNREQTIYLFCGTFYDA
jgi:hypothetical protein